MTLYYRMIGAFRNGCDRLRLFFAERRQRAYGPMRFPRLQHRMPDSRPQIVRVSFIHWYICWAAHSDYRDYQDSRSWLLALYLDMDRDLDPYFWLSIAWLSREEQLSACIDRHGRYL